jgi:hypothetical protein
MSKEHLQNHPERLNLKLIDQSLESVGVHWKEIDDELEKRKIGRKDVFTEVICNRLMVAYDYLDKLLEKGAEPFSQNSIAEMLVLNDKIHYGSDSQLQREYQSATKASTEQFFKRIDLISNWYDKHKKRGDHPLKLASEVYVSILARPQLFIEGNHRTGNLIANWISVYYGYAPFVLSADNAIAYFDPSAKIKHFANKLSMIGKLQLPKYNESFKIFWEKYSDKKYLI